MSLTPLERTSLHESGHAVIASLLGCKLFFAEADSDGGGMVRHVPASTADDKIAISAAGPIAELLHAGHGAPFWAGAWDGDYKNIADHLESTSGASELTVERACSKARDLLSTNWSTVLEIASELETMGRLPGSRIEQIIRQAASTSRPAPQQRATVSQTQTARLVTGNTGTARISPSGGVFGTGQVSYPSDDRGYPMGVRTLTLVEAQALYFRGA